MRLETKLREGLNTAQTEAMKLSTQHQATQSNNGDLLGKVRQECTETHTLVGSLAVRIEELERRNK